MLAWVLFAIPILPALLVRRRGTAVLVATILTAVSLLFAFTYSPRAYIKELSNYYDPRRGPTDNEGCSVDCTSKAAFHGAQLGAEAWWPVVEQLVSVVLALAILILRAPGTPRGGVVIRVPPELEPEVAAVLNHDTEKTR